MAKTQPDITAPVSRGRNASIGTIMNFGTAQGSAAGVIGNAGTNNSKGGIVDNGNLSFNQAPKNASYTSRDVENGGASFSVSTSSQNPTSIQNDSSNDVASQYVAKSTAGSVNSAGAGNFASIPRSDKVVEMPSAGTPGVRVVSAELDGQVYQNNPHFGENLSAGSTNNAQRITRDFVDTQANPNKKQNGKQSVGSSSSQVRNEMVDGGVNSQEFVNLLAVNNNSVNVYVSGSSFTGIQP
jgi:hypothetical protein